MTPPMTMRDRAIEAMARSMARSMARRTRHDFDALNYTSQDSYTRAATAALDALLSILAEPTEDVLMAGVTAPNYIEDQSSRRGCGNIFAAMLGTLKGEMGR